jgi:hypothetical protein
MCIGFGHAERLQRKYRQAFSDYINTRSSRQIGKKSINDLQSQAISEGASLWAVTISNLTREVERGENIDTAGNYKITCLQLAKYLYDLGRCYDRAYAGWKRARVHPPSSPRFVKKRQSRTIDFREVDLSDVVRMKAS